MATKHELEALRNDPLVQMYANAPEEIYQLAKNTNPMLRKAIEWAKAIVAYRKFNERIRSSSLT